MTQTPAPACLTKKYRSSGGAPASGTPAHSTNPDMYRSYPSPGCKLKLFTKFNEI